MFINFRSVFSKKGATSRKFVIVDGFLKIRGVLVLILVISKGGISKEKKTRNN